MAQEKPATLDDVLQELRLLLQAVQALVNLQQ